MEEEGCKGASVMKHGLGLSTTCRGFFVPVLGPSSVEDVTVEDVTDASRLSPGGTLRTPSPGKNVGSVAGRG